MCVCVCLSAVERFHERTNYALQARVNPYLYIYIPVLIYLYGLVRTHETTCCCNSRFKCKLSGTTGHRLPGTQTAKMLCVAAWFWFSLTIEFVVGTGVGTTGFFLVNPREHARADAFELNHMFVTPRA